MSSVTATNTSHDPHALLSVLLPSTSYILTYSIPLIFVSIILTFSGAFLILDRTRSFTPRQLPPESRRFPALLQSLLGGGVGGLAGGFSFGVHFVTFLSLLIPNTSASPPLSAIALLAVCMLSGVVCALVGGRWKHAAVTFTGITGFASLSLALSVMLHPGLLTRIIMTAILTFLGTVICLIPVPKYSHIPIRFAASAAGAFGVVLCVALLSRIPAWGDVWARLWTSNDIGWGSSKEKDISAAYCLLLVFGALSDWLLHRQLGQNPDEKWDRYLADYGDSLPNDNNRAGLFEPSRRFWDRLFKPHRDFHSLLPVEDIYGDDIDIKPPPGSLLPPRRRAWRDTTAELPFLRPPAGLRRHPQQRLLRGVQLKESKQFSPSPSDTMTLVGNSVGSVLDHEEENHMYDGVDTDTLFVRQDHHHQQADLWLKFWHDVKTTAAN